MKTSLTNHSFDNKKIYIYGKKVPKQTGQRTQLSRVLVMKRSMGECLKKNTEQQQL